jgi:osmoprotectant transport system ATP-binding protein
MAAAAIELRNVSKSFGGAGERPVLSGLTLRIEPGETLVLLGSSGSGKTTTLRTINRLIEPDEGEVLVDGRDVRDWDPIRLRRRTGYVIQDVGLLPHWSVIENVELVPRLQGWELERRRARADEMLTLVGLSPEEFREKRPHELSGGQRQRVGVARALAADPPLLLMDEPFGALDAINRRRLQEEFRELADSLGKTIVFVTHDVPEALRLADRVAVLHQGRLLQVETPKEIAANPAHPFVAELLRIDAAVEPRVS